MRNGLVLLLLFGTGPLAAQDPSAKITPAEGTPGRVSIGLAFSPEFAFRTLKTTENNETSKAVVALRNENEVARFGNSAGMTFTYAFDDHWSMGTGIGHTVKGYRTKMVDAVYRNFGDMIDPRTGFIYQNDPFIPEQFRSVYTFTYIYMPFQLNYSAGKGKWRSISSIGLNVEFLTSASSTFVGKYQDNGWKREKNASAGAFEKLSLSPTVSTGISRQIGKRWQLSMAGIGRYGVLRIIDTEITAHLWSLGLQLGCSFRL